IIIPPKTFKAEKVTALITDVLGRLWVGTQTSGLWCWDGEIWERMPIASHYQEPGVVGTTVRDICIDQQQRIWVATGQGITCFMDEVWRTIVVGLEPPSPEQVAPIWPIHSWTSCLHLDQAGRLLIGTSDGQLAWIDTTQAPYENPIDD